MIFVTVGTHDQSFDRLLAGMDELASDYDVMVVAQVGHSEYEPDNMEWFDFVSEAKINEYYERASVVVGHAGAGTILTALSYEKPLVLMPRREDCGEHLDDHQLELTEALQHRDGIFVTESEEELHDAVTAALKHTQSGIESNTGDLVRHLAEELEELVS